MMFPKERTHLSERKEINEMERIKKRWILESKNLLIEHRANKQWEDFCKIGWSRYEIMPFAFRFWNEIPNHLKREFALNCYLHHGDRMSGCRKAVRSLEKKGINELPKQYRNKDFIIVYRAGEEPINKSKYRLSWTLDQEIAEFFYSQYSHRHANYLYKAKIHPCDVIAYMDDRKEKEVIQYRKVYDVEVLKGCVEDD